jgi:hypothetical protein
MIAKSSTFSTATWFIRVKSLEEPIKRLMLTGAFNCIL